MNEEQFEKIERYVHEEMSSQERQQFEAELQRDAELFAELEAYQMIEEEMAGFDKEAALKASLQSIGASFISSDKPAIEQSAVKTAPVIPARQPYTQSSHQRTWLVA